MCGLCGVLSLDGVGQVDRDQVDVARMNLALAHRGPDDEGLATVSAGALGATRLAIRGLGGGHQPLEDPESGVVAACNGEIDNADSLREWLAERGRQVNQSTDVAVIPGLYLELGESFVERLEGVFAVAVWDPRNNRLLLARDRIGERPLFYSYDGSTVRFATEVAALTTHPSVGLTPDRAALQSFLRFGSFVAPFSPYADIRKVGPAEILCFENGRMHKRRYWRWSVSQAKKQPASIDAFDQILRHAVRSQSEVEVPAGVFLSGGIDSSLVAAIARRERPDQTLRSYTLRFGEDSYDEGAFAERVARHLGCEPESVWVTAESFPEGIAELISLVGEPLADPAWVPTAMLARRAAQDVKLVLVGEGADEIFGGYPTYLGALYSSKFAAWPSPLRSLTRKLVHSWPQSDKKVTIGALLKRFVDGAEIEGLTRHLLWTSNLTPELLRRLGVTDIPTLNIGSTSPVPSEADRNNVPSHSTGTRPGATAQHATSPFSIGGDPSANDATGTLLDRIQRHDLETSLAEGLLTKSDRAGMRSALELRAPFLAHAVLEFAATLPDQERVRGFRTKAFLKEYALRYLPRDIVHRRKRGLSIPLSQWLRGPLRDWAASRVGDARLADAGLDPDAAKELLEEHEARRADHARALWSLIVLDEWLRWRETQERERAARASR